VSADGIADKLKPLLKGEQIARFEVLQAERSAARAAAGVGAGQTAVGVASRLYISDADGKPVLTPIRLGATDGTNTEVLTGVTEGQKAIIGTSVKAKSGGASGPRLF
jgi:hypothetical protein